MPSRSPWPTPSPRSRPRTPAAGSSTAATLSPPIDPQSALENYLDRNLSQMRSIYWLTLLAMVGGFGFVIFGLYQASQYPEKLPVSIIASASGILVSFIGGTFLLIY